MAHYDTDVNCWVCKRYMYSYMHEDPDKEKVPWCPDCIKKNPKEHIRAQAYWEFIMHGKEAAEAI